MLRGCNTSNTNGGLGGALRVPTAAGRLARSLPFLPWPGLVSLARSSTSAGGSCPFSFDGRATPSLFSSLAASYFLPAASFAINTTSALFVSVCPTVDADRRSHGLALNRSSKRDRVSHHLDIERISSIVVVVVAARPSSSIG